MVNQARWRSLLKEAKRTGREIAPEWRSRTLFFQWLEEEEWQIRTKVGRRETLYFTTKFAIFDPSDVPLGPDNCGLVTLNIIRDFRAGSPKTGLPLGVARDGNYRECPFQGLVVSGSKKYRKWHRTAEDAHAYWQSKKIVVLEGLTHKLKYDGWVPLFEKAIASIREDLRLNRETKLK